jgi:hypothetical protein
MPFPLDKTQDGQYFITIAGVQVPCAVVYKESDGKSFVCVDDSNLPEDALESLEDYPDFRCDGQSILFGE